MGLHQDWKLLLKELYPSSWASKLPHEDDQYGPSDLPDVLLIDFLPFLFSKTRSIKTGRHFVNWVFKILREFFNTGGSTCAFLIDEQQYVPLAKAPAQNTRDKYKKPLNKEALKKPVIRADFVHEDWYTIMSHRELRKEIVLYFEESLQNFFETITPYTWKKWGCNQTDKGNEHLLNMKQILIDGGSLYPNPYIICSSGEIIQKPEWKNNIGEADCKILYYTNNIYSKRNILVQSIDSDMIRSLLLATLLRRDNKRNKLTNQIFLRLNDTQHTKNDNNESIYHCKFCNVDFEKSRFKSPADFGKSHCALCKIEMIRLEKRKEALQKMIAERQAKQASTETEEKGKNKIQSEDQETQDQQKKEKSENKKKESTDKGKEKLEENNDDQSTDKRKKNINATYLPDIVNINTLYYLVLDYWKMHCSSVDNPISTFAFLMTLGGDDFVKNLPNCGAKILHNVYLEHSKTIGDLISIERSPQSLATVTLNYPAIWLLIRHVYQYKLKRYFKNQVELPSYEELRQQSFNYKRPAFHCVPQNEIEAKLRRTRWVLLYILNGGNKGCPVPNCLEVDKNGISVHGWTVDSSLLDQGNIKKAVVRATIVSEDDNYVIELQREDTKNIFAPAIITFLVFTAPVAIAYLFHKYKSKKL